MLVKLNAALAFETLVLIAALFLLIYINKNQLSKWYRYAGIAIVIFVSGLILCSIGAGCRMARHHKMAGCEMGGGMRMQMMMNGGMGGCCEQMMPGCGMGMGMMGCGMGHGMRMHRGSWGGECCEKGKRGGRCEMEDEDDCCEMKKGKCDKEDDEEKEECMKKCKKDSVKKEVIIKK